MRLLRFTPLFSITLSLLLLAGCGGKDESEEKSGLSKLAESAQNMTKAIEEGGNTMMEDKEPQPPVSFRTLLTYLPDQIHEMEQRNPKGETATMGEWNYSQVSADYDGEEGMRATIQIFDYAYIGMLYAPVRMWLKMNINRESTEGFERTTEIAGFPAYEKWTESSQRAEATVLVGERFIVTVKTRNMPQDMPRDIAEHLRLHELAQEKGQPPA
ncbi:MAG: hypothetical protein KFH87_02630 [Bacteroidetes bacterium]|nr:hypothetical protein [Bacteroidota bacterium]